MKKIIPTGSRIDVHFTAKEAEDIRMRTYAPTFGCEVVPAEGEQTVSMTLDDVEELQGYVAAEANHTKDRRLQKRLDRIFDRLETFLDSYEEQEEVDSSTAGNVISFETRSRPRTRK